MSPNTYKAMDMKINMVKTKWRQQKYNKQQIRRKQILDSTEH